MIFVQLNKGNFEYDIHSLVKAFYPSENVSVSADAGGFQKPGQSREPNRSIKPKGPARLYLDVCYLPGEISLELKEPAAGSPFVLAPPVQACGDAGLWKKAAACSFAVDDTDRSGTKNLLKQHIYELFSAYTGRTLPWGTLTGIRPTKLAMKMLAQGCTKPQIEAYMQKTYLASAEKAALNIEIAQREAELLSRLDCEKGFSLYIGIPFCPSTCAYCSFPSYPISQWKGRVDDYLDALEQEIAFASRQYAHWRLNSVYIGGGTPTTLSAGQLERLISKIICSFDFSSLLEFTIEAGRPDSISREKLGVLRRHGISRISINPQTMKQETLDVIGRRHTVRQTIDSFYLAREMGFDNINMDLIMGLPNETLADVRHTMEELQKLEPDSITVHSLALKRAARLQMFPEDYEGVCMVNTQQHLDAARSACRKMGMEPYYLYRQKNMAGNFENIGYAKEGKAGIYNVLIMEEKQSIIACGAGGISKRVYPDGYIKRSENVKDVSQYIERIGEMIERKRVLFEDERFAG